MCDTDLFQARKGKTRGVTIVSAFTRDECKTPEGHKGCFLNEMGFALELAFFSFHHLSRRTEEACEFSIL